MTSDENTDKENISYIVFTLQYTNHVGKRVALFRPPPAPFYTDL
jgi:hypothetical protein